MVAGGHGFCDQGLVHFAAEVNGWHVWFCGHADVTKTTVGPPPWATPDEIDEAGEVPELRSMARAVGAEALRRARLDPQDRPRPEHFPSSE